MKQIYLNKVIAIDTNIVSFKLEMLMKNTEH